MLKKVIKCTLMTGMLISADIYGMDMESRVETCTRTLLERLEEALGTGKSIAFGPPITIPIHKEEYGDMKNRITKMNTNQGEFFPFPLPEGAPSIFWIESKLTHNSKKKSCEVTFVFTLNDTALRNHLREYLHVEEEKTRQAEEKASQTRLRQEEEFRRINAEQAELRRINAEQAEERRLKKERRKKERIEQTMIQDARKVELMARNDEILTFAAGHFLGFVRTALSQIEGKPESSRILLAYSHTLRMATEGNVYCRIDSHLLVAISFFSFIAAKRLGIPNEKLISKDSDLTDWVDQNFNLTGHGTRKEKKMFDAVNYSHSVIRDFCCSLGETAAYPELFGDGFIFEKLFSPLPLGIIKTMPIGEIMSVFFWKYCCPKMMEYWLSYFHSQEAVGKILIDTFIKSKTIDDAGYHLIDEIFGWESPEAR